jgi:hypothetical protein
MYDPHYRDIRYEGQQTLQFIMTMALLGKQSDSDPSYRGQLGEGTEGPRGRGQGVVASRGASKGRLWRKGSRKEVEGGRWRHATRQRALIPSFLSVNVLVNHIAVNRMDPYDSDSSDGVASPFRSPQSPNPPPFNDPNYEAYKGTASSSRSLITLLINVTVQRSRRSGNTAESAVGSTMAQLIGMTTAITRGF